MTTPSQYEGFRERIRANWNDEQTIESWRRWHAKVAEQMRSVNDALLSAAHIRPGIRALDLASGSGEPALQIAHAIAPAGTVIATDISGGMLKIARENAEQQRLTNISFAPCDAEELPFDDNAFDAVTCRMGAMFFVDLQRALSEIRRVLRPGGRAAFAAWGPLERNEFFFSLLQPFFRRIDAPAPPADAPHPFRFSRPDALARELRVAQFHDVRESMTDMAAPWPGSPEEAWQVFYEMAAPPFVDELADEDRRAAIREGIDTLRPLYDGKTINARAAIVLVSGTKR